MGMLSKEELALYKKLAKIETSVTKDSKNPFHKNTYASVGAYYDAIKPELEKAGLYMSQPQLMIDGQNVQATIIVDLTTGAYVESVMSLPVDVKPQEAASATTYYRRYTISGLLSTLAEDDDGNASSNVVPKTSTTKTRSRGRGTRSAEFR